MSDLREYLGRLRALPPVRSLRPSRSRSRDQDGNVTLAIRTPAGTHQLDVVQFAHRLSALMVAILKPAAPGTRLVMAPIIAGQAARLLADGGTNYVDLEGNCHLVLGDEVYVHVEGKVAPQAAPADRGIRAAGFQVLFTYLAGPYVERSVRAVGELAGTSRQTVLEMRDRLRDEGYLVESARGLDWNPRRKDDALRRWLEGYQSTLRPRLLVGTYRTKRSDPRDVAALIEAAAGPPGERWRWGGSAAAYELRRHYRGERTTIHVREPTDPIVSELPALRDPGGNLVVLRSFGDISWKADPLDATVHPLLVYSELLVGDDERAREAAADLFDALIRPTWAA